MIFRLATLLYLFALVAASCAVIGAWGIAVVAGVLLLWRAYLSHEWDTRFGAIVLAVGLLLFGLAQIPIDTPREAARTMGCRNRLRNTSFAIENGLVD
ncbi:hypothetical protein [Aeoliella mucimassa]|uniref:Uncharacterized protein n=1 Tax=Aeoliella mucimassa TaxID=2527972 RepID=A0A518AGN2_9BACT|nr:hypothetical protein [Aeoliella mucimassa]QDU53885.1 hypothetical protein Pan181_00630 [Aeoliella mucimassa]